MADAQAPTEQQLAAVQAQQDARNAAWQDDFKEEDLIIPYKRDAEDEGSDKKTEEEDKDDDVIEDEKATEVTAPDKPVSAITTDDPGEYKAADYSFEVTLASGKTVKISTPEEAEKLADDPDNFETAKQLMDFINKQNKMQRNLDRDYDKWEAKKKEHDGQVEQQKEREQVVQNLANGFEYLIGKGLMPAIDPQDSVADWNDPETAKHAGVKEQIALINYMQKENAAREKAGIPVLTSALDAYNAWKLETNQQEAADERKNAGVARKAASARVAGVSSSQQGTYVPKGIAVGRVLPMRGAAIWDD